MKYCFHNIKQNAARRKAQVKIFLPFHIDSGNRGCEGITRGTVSILDIQKENIHVLTHNKKEDIKTGLDRVVCLQELDHEFKLRIVKKAVGWVGFLLNKDIELMICFIRFMRQAYPGDIILITGGDLYCYPELEWQLRFVCQISKWRRCKLVLWGCSIDKKRLNKRLISHLKIYDQIYARETCTKMNLKDSGIKNIKQMCDPAFKLDAKPCCLPEGLEEGNVVGINISNYTNQKSYSMNTIFLKNILKLVKYILEETSFQILLIPHVLWKDQDDRILLKKIYRLYNNTGRILLLSSDNLSYCQIRYVISRCRFFIGSRTHSIISAYSMGIPSLALGYSVKSKGILKDFKISDKLLLDCNKLISEEEVLKRFIYLMNNEKKFMKVFRELSIYIHTEKTPSLFFASSQG